MPVNGVSRRAFLSTSLGSALFAPVRARPAWTGQASPSLPRPRDVQAEGLRLTASRLADARGVWAVNGVVPGPTIRARVGDAVSMELVNDLGEETILHWHGLDVPPQADGHPRLAIGPGETYRYAFTVRNRPGTYWYHPHPDGRTGLQTYRGLAGFFLVDGEEEGGLELPTLEHDMPLLLQDRRLDRDGYPVFLPFGHDHMEGYVGDHGFVNGVERPVVEVDRARYRLRMLNACNARILQVTTNPAMPMTLIGGDGGLLERPWTFTRALLGNAERFDVLVDFSSSRPGDRITLRSSGFEVPGSMAGMGMMRGRGPGGGRGRGMGDMGRQGSPLDLLDFVVRDTPSRPAPPVPERLSVLPALEPERGAPRRRFVFESRMDRHTINGRRFRMDRVDVEVALGEVEIWTFVNESSVAHPVHVHGGGFRVRSRSGGRGRVEPWEAGIKDTVLVFPNERVEVAIQFPRHRGLFLMHCHNLEHEDMGMMANVAVV